MSALSYSAMWLGDPVKRARSEASGLIRFTAIEDNDALLFDLANSNSSI